MRVRSDDQPVDAASRASTSFHAARPRRLAWDTRDVRPAEQFAFYREAVCKAFMTLSPETASQASFSAKIESIRVGDAAINRVVFPAHTVRRSSADIAASTSRCYYLNLMLAGRCRIQQSGRDVDLVPGQVALFDSGRQFALLHAGSRPLAVASLWVPHQALHDRLPAGCDVDATRLSDDPLVGHLIAETARALNVTALDVSEEDGSRLFGVLLDLVALSLSRRSPMQAADSAAFVDATTLALRRAIHDRIRKPGLSVADVAAAVGISERYVHKLFARTGQTFASYVMERRLDGAARDLRDAAMGATNIGSIAFDWGFSDLSHFTRRFRQRFGCTPRDWRHSR
jgi:AraC family transcriptional regulator, positive regulator of tynA and feaB